MSGIQNNPSLSVASWGGTTNISGKSMSIEQKMQLVLLDSTQIQQSSLEDQVNDMAKRNEWSRDANAALGELRKNRPSDTTSVADYGTGVADFFQKNGIAINMDGPNGGQDTLGNQNTFDQAIANMKSAIDSASSTSQLDMVRLGATQTKLGQAWDMLSQNQKKVADTQSSAIRNW